MPIVLATAALGACSAPDTAAPVLPTAETLTEAAPDLEFDVESACKGISDLMTIHRNAEAGWETGRMEALERDGWFHVATSVLERMPSEGDHPVARSLAELQTVAPHDSGRYDSPNVGTAEWVNVTMEIYGHCEEAGHEPPTWMFTGG